MPTGEVSVANYYSRRNRQVIKSSAAVAPAVGMQIQNTRSYLPGFFARSDAVQRIVAPLIVVEILEAREFALQVSIIPKGNDVEILSGVSRAVIQRPRHAHHPGA